MPCDTAVLPLGRRRPRPVGHGRRPRTRRGAGVPPGVSHRREGTALPCAAAAEPDALAQEVRGPRGSSLAPRDDRLGRNESTHEIVAEYPLAKTCLPV